MAYSECKTSSRSIYGSAQLNRVSFVLSQKGVIYIDMLDFVDHMAFQSRDKIVPAFTTKWKDATFSWQQTHRWSKQKPPLKVALKFSIVMKGKLVMISLDLSLSVGKQRRAALAGRTRIMIDLHLKRHQTPRK